VTSLAAGYTQPQNSVGVYRGQSKTFELRVTDEVAAVVDLTGATVWFTVKGDLLDRDPTILKVSSDPVQIKISEPKRGVALIYLQPDDTRNLEIQEYVFDVWVQLASGKRYPVIPPSVFVVEAGVTVIA
jgi:hypothetical protein